MQCWHYNNLRNCCSVARSRQRGPCAGLACSVRVSSAYTHIRPSIALTSMVIVYFGNLRFAAREHRISNSACGGRFSCIPILLPLNARLPHIQGVTTRLHLFTGPRTESDSFLPWRWTGFFLCCSRFPRNYQAHCSPSRTSPCVHENLKCTVQRCNVILRRCGSFKGSTYLHVLPPSTIVVLFLDHVNIHVDTQ